MAENQKPDQGKITGEAENLASGGKRGNRQSPAAVTGSEGTTAGNLQGKGSIPSNVDAAHAATSSFAGGNAGARKPGDTTGGYQEAQKAESDVREELVKLYGNDYVTATRELNGHTETRYFSRTAWRELQKSKEQNRGGWTEQVNEPQEVTDLRNRQEGAQDDPPREPVGNPQA